MLRLTTLGTADIRLAGGESADAVLTAPKRLALLAYLTLARPRGFHRRDVVLALLWPEVETDRGRGTLRTTLYHLRQAIGPDVVVARGDEVGIDRAALSCDALEFGEHLDAGRLAEAMALYRGPLLPGCYVSGAPAWERWLESERARLAERAMVGAWALADAAVVRGDHVEAGAWARRALELRPDDEATVARHIALLDSIGDRTGAIDAYERFAEYLRVEFEEEPSAGTRRLIDAVRARSVIVAAPAPRRAAVAPPHSPTEPTPVAHAIPHAVPSRRRRGRTIGIAAAFAAIVFVGTALVLSARPAVPVLAVTKIDAIGTPDSLQGIAVLLTTSIARVPDLRVVSETRLAELQAGATGAGRPESPRSLAAAAGAQEILEGTIAARSRGGYRLDLRRVAVRDGVTRGAFMVESTDLSELVDLATEWVAAEYGVTVSSTRFAAATTSLVAYRVYEHGLRAYYSGNRAEADRLFRTALAEDSTFTMAAYFLARTSPNETEAWRLIERAERLGRTGSDRERLVTRAAWAFHMQDPSRLAVAETLVTRYPLEPESHMLYADALIGAGAFSEAMPHLERLAADDRPGESSVDPRCWACEARGRIGTVLARLDSFPGLERHARATIARHPRDAVAWGQLAYALLARGRYDAALGAARRGAALGGEDSTEYRPTAFFIPKGDFAALDLFWGAHLPHAERAEREGIYWDQVIQYRTQGRLREALAAADAYRKLAGSMAAPQAEVLASVPRATALMDARRFAEAAALFDSMASVNQSGNASRYARHKAWMLAHAAGAYAAMGDTTRLRALEDTLRAVGSQSAYMRDRLLHHYVRGLRLGAQRRPGEAAEALRQSVYSLSEGYSRINVELARAHLVVGRSAEAIGALEAALRGPISSTGLYAARTEVTELLGDAYARAGRRRDAAAAYEWVIKAWERADPEMVPRREAVRRRLVEVGAR